MPLAHHRAIAAVDQTYWWHRFRFEVVNTILAKSSAPQSVVDVGCGPGGFLEMLARRHPTWSLHGVDSNPVAIQVARERGIPATLMEIGEDARLPLTPDWITLLDVLEHVPHPEPLLRALVSSCRSSTELVMTVPAHPFLFSEWDVRLGHVQRYTRQSLEKLLGRCGFRVLRMSHLLAFAVPLVFLQRKVLRTKSVGACEFPSLPPWVAGAFLGLARFENRLSSLYSLPCGTSILCHFAPTLRS